ncbi:MAG: 5'/3'-nucleotidase SurE [Pseudomonadota bacterium]|nr:5'/3'-nucleotidase SurE [Pseudomonadota bacterium]
MRILVSNDDGIHAPGLKVLERIAKTLSDDVWVVAPEMEQSGAAHSLTLSLPVRVRKVSAKRYAVSGTPTDCVLLGLSEIIPNSLPHRGRVRVGADSAEKSSPPPSLPPTGGGVNLVLSGVNNGSNVGDDVTYSGTVAAAMEGTILDVPSIALSQIGDRDRMHWATAEQHAPALIKKLIAIGWPRDTLININFPDCAADKVKGVRVCPQGKRLVGVSFLERLDPRGRPYFWIGGDREDKAAKPDVDIDLLAKGYITVTPLCLNLTDYRAMEKLRKGL